MVFDAVEVSETNEDDNAADSLKELFRLKNSKLSMDDVLEKIATDLETSQQPDNDR